MQESVSNQKDEKDKEKHFEIIVNGRKRNFVGKIITYTEVVAISLDGAPFDPNTIYSVTYRKGDGHKPEGSLVDGDSVKVKDGMVFNVTATTKS